MLTRICLYKILAVHKFTNLLNLIFTTCYIDVYIGNSKFCLTLIVVQLQTVVTLKTCSSTLLMVVKDLFG